MWKDPIVEEVRSIRERLAAEQGFDLTAIFQKLRADQQAHGPQLVRRQARKHSKWPSPSEPPALVLNEEPPPKS